MPETDFCANCARKIQLNTEGDPGYNPEWYHIEKPEQGIISCYKDNPQFVATPITKVEKMPDPIPYDEVQEKRAAIIRNMAQTINEFVELIAEIEGLEGVYPLAWATSIEYTSVQHMGSEKVGFVHVEPEEQAMSTSRGLFMMGADRFTWTRG